MLMVDKTFYASYTPNDNHPTMRKKRTKIKLTQ